MEDGERQCPTIRHCEIDVFLENCYLRVTSLAAMLALGCPMGLVAGGVILTGFAMVKPKVKMELDMKLNVKTMFKAKVLFAVVWSYG